MVVYHTHSIVQITMYYNNYTNKIAMYNIQTCVKIHTKTEI